MPRYNGLDVLKDLKADQDLKNIPVFLLTNLPAESSGDKAKALGAAGYLVKAEYEPKMVLDVIQGAAQNQK
jgi:CheY-like chemotaxis protein